MNAVVDGAKEPIPSVSKIDGTDDQNDECSYDTNDDSRDKVLLLHALCPCLVECKTCDRVLLGVGSHLFLLSEHQYYDEDYTEQ